MQFALNGMNRMKLALIVIAAALAGCASKPVTNPEFGHPAMTLYSQPEHLKSDAQAIVDSFANEVQRVRGKAPSNKPTVRVDNTPQLIFYSGKSNTITVPLWKEQPEQMKAVFRRFSGGNDAEAERFFGVFFNKFLVAHEASHWFQSKADKREKTLYANENQANRLAVAFWRTQQDGDRFLAVLEELATRAAESVPNPTPAGEDPVAYFGANYQTLGQDPLKYGYYQFRFMADAIRDRSQLDFAEMTTGKN